MVKISFFLGDYDMCEKRINFLIEKNFKLNEMMLLKLHLEDLRKLLFIIKSLLNLLSKVALINQHIMIILQMNLLIHRKK